MTKLVKRIYLLLILVAGFSFAGSAAAATANFGFDGTFSYTKEGKLFLKGEKISLLSQWDTNDAFWEIEKEGSFVGNHVLTIENKTVFLPSEYFKLIFLDNTIHTTLFIASLIPELQMSGSITLSEDSSSAPIGVPIDMTNFAYSGTFSSEIAADIVATPVPTSLTILGIGLVALAGFRRSPIE